MRSPADEFFTSCLVKLEVYKNRKIKGNQLRPPRAIVRHRIAYLRHHALVHKQPKTLVTDTASACKAVTSLQRASGGTDMKLYCEEALVEVRDPQISPGSDLGFLG